MASTKTRIKPIRIANETADYFEGKPLNRMVESLCEMIQSGKIEFDGENLKVKGVYTDKISQKSEASPSKYEIDEKILDDLATMQTFMGGSVGEMIRLFDEAVNEGVITYDNGKFVGNTDIDLGRFKEACHDINRDPQEILDKVVGMIEKGRI